MASASISSLWWMKAVGIFSHQPEDAGCNARLCRAIAREHGGVSRSETAEHGKLFTDPHRPFGTAQQTGSHDVQPLKADIRNARLRLALCREIEIARCRMRAVIEETIRNCRALQARAERANDNTASWSIEAKACCDPHRGSVP